MSECYDCERPYTAASFPDLVIEDWAWKRISPTGDAGGLLCPCCILERLHIEGIDCMGALMSGAVTPLSRGQMQEILRLERKSKCAFCDGLGQTWDGSEWEPCGTCHGSGEATP